MQFSAIFFLAGASVLQDASTFFLRLRLKLGHSVSRSALAAVIHYCRNRTWLHTVGNARDGLQQSLSLSSTGYELVKALSTGCWLDGYAKAFQNNRRAEA